jgi:hypothetical protein
MAGKHKQRRKPKPKDPIWTCRDGKKLRVSQIADSHLLNIMYFLKRKVETELLPILRERQNALALLFEGAPFAEEVPELFEWGWWVPSIYPYMQEEARRRGILPEDLELPADANAQHEEYPG